MSGWPIPPDFPLDELIGQEVTQVCISAAQVHIQLYRQPQADNPEKWKPGARIDVESDFTLQNSDSSSIRVGPQMFKLGGGQLAMLLGETIGEVLRAPGNELRVTFSNGFSLHLHTDPQGFESFHLHIGGESISVTGA